MSIEAVKEKARKHELKEQWQKALDLYLEAIRQLDEEEDLDISLYNRVGDLEVRMDKVDAAVEHYEKAVDLYMESELPNNAIAVCKKVIRNLPDRHSIFLKMGQIRASQGFLTDARQNFLTYAEAMQARGDMESAFQALVEFVELAPDDIEIRLALAEQLAQHGRTDEAVEQFKEARRRLILNDRDDEARSVADRLGEVGPGESLMGADEIRNAEPEEVTTIPEEIDDWASAFAFSDEEGEADVEAAPEEEEEEEEHEVPAGAGREDLGGEENFVLGGELEAAEEAEPLPTFGFGDEEEEEEEEEAEAEAIEAPADDDWLSAVDAGAKEEPGEEEPGEEEPVETAAVEEAVHLDPERLWTRSRQLREEGRDAKADDLLQEAHETLAEEGRIEDAVDVLSELIRAHPDAVDLRQRHVEYAYRLFDDDALVSAYHGLAETLRDHDEDRKAKAVYQQILDTDPDNEEATRAMAEIAGAARPGGERKEVTSSEEYVDLGSMILDEEEKEKSTRFVVAAEAPSGDEEADFARMLDQFKDKVAENVATDDVAAHYDLGTAYKEMGLVDEAVGEFQAALRADREHLPTYEVLGQCFLEKGQPDAAARTLKKALNAPYEVEDELLGIYYFLGRAHEAMGDEESAVKHYDRVFDLDINFMDVHERLRNLR